MAIGLVVVGLTWATVQPAQAASGINSQINFQGRLLNAAGAVVADGNYNMQFKIYQDGPGNVAGDTGGTLKWTETRENVASAGVVVKNGYFSVSLGSVNAFAGSVDWNQDTLWLSTNIAGTGTGASPAYDGEMLPMKRLSAAPYALQAANSGQLGGLASSQFVQLAQGVQTDSSTTQPSIGVNKTAGSQNLITLQASGTDVFDVTSTGNLQFGNNADKTISIATATSGSNGNNLTVQGGSGNGTNKNGGNLMLQGGNSTGSGTPGAVIVKPQTDLAGAFQVQSSTGASLLSVDSSNGGNVMALANNSSVLSSWTTNANSMNTARVRTGAVSANGYLYAIGGNNGSGTTVATTEFAKINADGSVGSWTNSNPIAVTGDSNPARRQFAVTTANGYVYVIGGKDDNGGGVARNTVYYAKLNPDGSMSSTWNATTVLPSQLFGEGAVFYGGYLYVIGGFNSGATVQTTVYSAKVNPDGTVGSWSTASTTALPAGVSNINGSIVANGYLYVPGGWNGSSDTDVIRYIKLAEGGATTGSWTTTSTGTIPGGGDENHATFVANGYLYLAGGDGGSRVTSFQLNANGSLGASNALSTTFPSAGVTLGEAGMAAANGYLYVLGGSTATDGGGTARSSVYYAATPRLKVGGSLDLVGYSGANLFEGSTGGQLTAGNTTVVGTLQVQDAVTLVRGLTLGGTLAVGGSAAFRNAADSTTALQVLNAAGTSVLGVDTANGRVGIGNAAPSYPLDVTGDINTTTQYRVGGTVICASSGCTPTAGSGNYINNGTSAQTASFYVQGGSGNVAGVLRANGADALDIKNASAVNVLTVGATGDLLVKPSTSSATALQVQPSGSSTSTLIVDTSAGKVGINTNSPAYALDVNGSINASTSVLVGGIAVCTVSSCTPASGSNNYIQNGTTVQTAANLHVRSAATNAVTAVLEGASGQTSDILQVQSWNGTSTTNLLTVGNTGISTFQGTATSTAALTVKTPTGGTNQNVLQVDTVNERVGIGVMPNIQAKLNVVTSSTTGLLVYQGSVTNNIAEFTTGGSGPGTVTVGSASPNITGSSTTFTKLFRVGDPIYVASGAPQVRIISTITSDTAMTATTNFTSGTSGLAYTMGALGAGTVTTNGTTTLTGSGTTFTTLLRVGDTVLVDGETPRTVNAIASDTSLTTTSAFSTSVAGLKYMRAITSNLVVTPSGTIGVNTNSPQAAFQVVPPGIGQKGLVVTAGNGQTANLFEIQNSGGSSVASFGATGNLSVSGTYNTNTFTANSLVFGTSGNATISSAPATAGAGSDLTLNSTTGFAAGNAAGNILLTAANGNTTGTGGGISLTGGSTQGSTTGRGGDITLTAGATSGTSGGIDRGGNVTITGGAASAGASGPAAGNVIIQGGNSTSGVAGSLTLDSGTGSTATLNVGSTNASTIQIGNSASSVTVGATSGTGTITVGQSTGANTINIGNANLTASTQTVNIGTASTSTGADAVTVGSTNGASVLNLQAGTGNVNVKTSTSAINSPMLSLQQAGGGDATIELKNSGSTSSYYVGNDASNSNTFSIGSNTAATLTGTTTLGQDYSSQSPDGTDTNSTSVHATKFTAGATGTISSLSVAFDNRVDGTSTYSVAIYSDNGAGGSSAAPNNVLGQHSGTTVVSITTPGANNWNTQTLDSPVSITSGTQYWLVVGLNDTSPYKTRSTVITNNSYYRNAVPTVGTWGATWTAAANGTANGTSSFELAIYGSISSSGSLTDTFTNSLFTLSQTGAANFRNSFNSTTAFQVQNASSTNLFQIDTSNNRIYVGSSTSDAVAAQLVLDTSSGSTDPNGVNGAIYYNTGGRGGADNSTSTFSGKFRCYEASVWKNCIGMRDMSERRWGYAVPQGTAATSMGVSGLFNATILGEGASGTVASSNQAESNYVIYPTGAVSGNKAGIGNTFSATAMQTRWLPKLVTRIRVDASAVTTARYWVALTSASLDAQNPATASAALGTSYVGLGVSSAVNSSKWLCGSGNGTNHSGTDTGVTMTAGHYYDIILDLSTSGTLVCSIADNGGAYTTVSKTTLLPTTTTSLGLEETVTTLTTAARNLSVAYSYLEYQ